MFTQFGPAVLNRLYFGAGGGLDCGNRKSLHRHYGDCQKNRKNRVPKHSLKGGPFFHGPSLAGGGVDYGLMSFYRFSRSASYDCEGKGDDNERVFHGRIPSLLVSACPVLRQWAVTKITEFSFQTRHFVSVQNLPGFALWGAWRRTPPSCRSCCAGRRRRAIRDEVQSATLHAGRAMSAYRPTPEVSLHRGK
jgi:hypothetical protein